MSCKRLITAIACLLAAGAATLPADAQPIRKRLMQRMKEKSAAAQPIDPGQYVAGATRKSAVYGTDADQSMEVYLPSNPDHAPVIVMVHGGGWRVGDKNMTAVVENKIKHWLPKGYIFISIDYRMLPDAGVDVQAQDVAAAIAYIEKQAPSWGGDAAKLILMGHSAGAHLVALMSADPSRVRQAGGHDWAASVVLDSAAYDVAAVMKGKHLDLYDDAFGSDPAYWARLSPRAQLKAEAVPMMLVCALKRSDNSCGQSHNFAEALKGMGQSAPVVELDMKHAEVNAQLGLPGAYTDSVDSFITAHLGTKVIQR
ncbi:hypothetical protein MMA231_02220 [Asticcacaulis sp. MM231]|uniref:alpha/beta hydrolase n=1 Tax=Asticcacaulis sp. MM231 TaxID=3157666 RepID=UPI0032D589FD